VSIERDDAERMARLQRGDSFALDELMREWQVPLRRFLQRYLHDENEAMDVAQETFLRVYRYRKRFRPGARFSTWLFTIARNLARRRFRTWTRRPTVSLDECLDALEENALPREDVTAISAAPDATLVRRETVQRGSASDRTTDAAAVIGCSAKAIETRLYRARSVLSPDARELSR
jgi:RNA polymerase sigma-70 factor (ECF subfamily)